MLLEFKRQMDAVNSGVESLVDFRDRDKWFVVRISRYTRSDRKINGAALTFTNAMAQAISSSRVLAIQLERAAG